MRKNNIMPFILIVLLCINGCSIRYISYKNATRKVLTNKISSEQFDEKFYKLYKTTKTYSFSDTSLPIKFIGSYVNQDTDGKYRVCKFLPNGKVIQTCKMNAYPNNISLLKIKTEHNYYKIDGNNIEVEYLLFRDWNLYNIFMIGEIKGDSIIFSRLKNKQIPWDKSNVRSVYIYDKTLIANPI